MKTSKHTKIYSLYPEVILFSLGGCMWPNEQYSSKHSECWPLFFCLWSKLFHQDEGKDDSQKLQVNHRFLLASDIQNIFHFPQRKQKCNLQMRTTSWEIPQSKYLCMSWGELCGENKSWCTTGFSLNIMVASGYLYHTAHSIQSAWRICR